MLVPSLHLTARRRLERHSQCALALGGRGIGVLLKRCVRAAFSLVSPPILKQRYSLSKSAIHDVTAAQVHMPVFDPFLSE